MRPIAGLRSRVAFLALAFLLISWNLAAAGGPAPGTGTHDRTWVFAGTNKDGKPDFRYQRVTYVASEMYVGPKLAQQIKDENFSYSDGCMKRVKGRGPSGRQNCAGFVLASLVPDIIPGWYNAQSADLAAICQTFGTPVAPISAGKNDIAVFYGTTQKNCHVALVDGKTMTLGLVMLSKDGIESLFQYTMGWFSGNCTINRNYPSMTIYRCNLRMLQIDEVSFEGVWEENGADSVQIVPAGGGPGTYFIKTLVGDPQFGVMPGTVTGRMQQTGGVDTESGLLLQAKGVQRNFVRAKDKSRCPNLTKDAPASMGLSMDRFGDIWRLGLNYAAEVSFYRPSDCSYTGETQRIDRSFYKRYATYPRKPPDRPPYQVEDIPAPRR